MEQIEQLSVNTIRFLSAEAIQKANSGHPGLPLGAAPAAYALWAKEMKHNPANPDWADRDRFVLSAGHGSAMLYSLLHLFGYGLTIEDLKQFRQKGSLTPGHPEYKWTKGVEITTGPLGQGCLMEGVSSEAASLAATMGLGKLILLYDSNNITIEGSTDIAFTEDVLKRFEAYGWHTQEVSDGTDINTIAKAIEFAKKEKSKPSIIKINTIIGYGAPNKQGKASAHGEPLGEEEIKAAKQNVAWTETESFAVPQQVVEHMKALQLEGAKKEQEWNTLFEQYKKANPELAKEWEIWHNDKLPVDLLNDEDYWTYEGDIATRASSEKVLQKLSKAVPNLMGGSADLAPSNKSVMKDRQYYSAQTPEGSNIHFGIREFAMTAMANGMAAHGGLRPYIAGFFVFSDYMKSGLRMSALMKLPVISIMTHDSIGVGEDGPTHQPVEHLAALRSMPNYTVFRPCDTRETAAGWLAGLLSTTSPTALVLTRQNLPLLEGTGKEALKGAYVLKDCEGTPDILLMASGSEVELIYKAYDVLADKGVKARVISMPSFELFEKQPQEYKESVLPNAVRNRVAVEAASSFGWHKYVGLDGETITIDEFGASAPAATLFKEFGFTVENVVETALKVVGK